MEEQVAELVAKVAALEAQGAGANNSAFGELYYYLTIPLMVIIHAGFLAYEMGASRLKNVLASGIKNILAFAFMVPTFYYFGFFIYWAWTPGLIPTAESWQVGVDFANPVGEVMGPHLGDQITGVFWGAFTLFAATTASIFSGAVIERIQVVGFIILAIVLGSVAWIMGAAWGWSAAGWLVTEWGYHDFGAAGVVHMVAGFFALGVLINLGPRIGKFNPDGTANDISGHNMPLTCIGLMLIIVGFWGFLMGCVVVPGESWSWFPDKWATIYGTPMTLSAMTFNILMGFAGGIIGAWMVTRDPFWMMSGALGGIISCASGLDFFEPTQAFVIGFIGGSALKPAAAALERLGIDDAVGAVTVHGTIGFWGVMAAGIFGMGYPALGTAPEGADMPTISLVGQFVGAVSMFLLGFVPGYLVSLVLKMVGLLRVGEAAEINGLDPTKVPLKAYPEGIIPSATAAE
ncbi:MAG: ammonium transporter [Pseudomonadota bacterium]